MAEKIVYLVGVDIGKASERAALFAAEQASHAGARLHLCHVVDWSAYDILAVEEMEHRHADRKAKLRSVQADILDPLEKKLAASGVPVTTNAHFGDPAELLLDIGRDMKAAQIFIGTDQQSELSVLFLGSVARELLRKTDRPVTVVP